TLLLLVVISYLTLVLYLGLAYELWVYGILRTLSWPFRIVFIVGCGLVIIAFYIIGVYLHRFFWPEMRIYSYTTRYWKSNVKICTDHEFENFRVVQGLIKNKA